MGGKDVTPTWPKYKFNAFVKPLLLNTYDAQGGAGIATYRIHQALRSIGIDSILRVQSQKSDDYTVIGPSGWHRIPAMLRPYLDSLPNRFFKRAKKELFSVAWVPDRLLGSIAEISPDLVHLFWVNNGFLRLETPGKIKQPCIWTLHDMWPFTGGCHYDDGCARFMYSCGSCPSVYSSSNNDVSRRILRRKLSSWSDWDVTVVATSKWLAERASVSAVFRNRDIRVVPNAIDIEVYKPIPKSVARMIYNLPQDKRIIIFSAFASTSHPRKGGHLLMEAIERIANSHFAPDVELVIVGASIPEKPRDLGMPVHYMGHFSDEISQVVLYSAADVLVAPSMQENLSNTVLEALACGTPVVAFHIGGMPDMISHKKNGYLAEPFATEDLAEGILWVLNDDDRLAQLSNAARNSVTETYSFPIVAARYLELYGDVLGKKVSQ